MLRLLVLLVVLSLLVALPARAADLVLVPGDRGDPDRKQRLYLYHVESGARVPLGSFDAPQAYRGEWRCDLHPRASPDGRWVVIDSAHGGNGRQLYLIDIGDIF